MNIFNCNIGDKTTMTGFAKYDVLKIIDYLLKETPWERVRKFNNYRNGEEINTYMYCMHIQNVHR